MYKANNGIPAFSVMETVVAMAITAIVMGLIFFIFTIVTERMLDYRNQNQLVSDMNRLTYSINKDIFESQQMQSQEGMVVFSGYAGNTVQYQIQPERILRQSETFTDTFQIATARISIDTVQSPGKKNVFRKLALQVTVDERPLRLLFFKRVYPNELFTPKP